MKRMVVMKEGKTANAAKAADGADPRQTKRAGPQARRSIRRSLFPEPQRRQAMRGGDGVASRALERKGRAQAPWGLESQGIKAG